MNQSPSGAFEQVAPGGATRRPPQRLVAVAAPDGDGAGSLVQALAQQSLEPRLLSGGDLDWLGATSLVVVVSPALVHEALLGRAGELAPSSPWLFWGPPRQGLSVRAFSLSEHALAADVASFARALVDMATAEGRAQQAERALSRVERLRLLGQLSSGVLHDLQNVLYPLSLYLQLGRRAVDKGAQEQARDALREAEGIVKLGAASVQRLRSFGRDTAAGVMSDVALDQVARDSVGIARARLSTRGEGSAVELALETHAVPTVWGDGGEIAASVVNLVVNAIDACAGHGHVVVATGELSPERVFVEVRDDGCGMTEDVKRRVFEPFFSTKGDRGTGIGMSMVQGCLRRHGGDVEIDTSPGKGTRIRLIFPREPHSQAVRR